MKRFFALFLCTILLLTMFPVSTLAVEAETADLWEQIIALEDQAAARRGADSVETRAAVYSGIVDQIIALVERSENFVSGSIIRHGDFFYWDEADGTACGYSPRLRAQIRENAVPNADPEACSGIETVSYSTRGGNSSSLDVAAFQPYIGLDSSFTAQYENRCNSLAQALGGTGTTYKTNNATIDNIAHAIETCAVVIFDSHGDTDYASGSDYTSRANTSYICLQNGAGITAADQETVTGPYGTYKHAYYAGPGYYGMQYYCVDGTAISNHMTGTSPNGLLWMAICLGMATDGMHAPLRAKGVEVAYGYSQSVTFSGDYAWEGKFWPKMIDGAYVKDAIAYMKQMVGCPDPFTGSRPAWPIVVSSEDVYPGHGNVDQAQTVYSTWTLYNQFEITAVPNNPDWGTVQVASTKITATPAYGYYVDGFEILEGQARVSRNGNVFTVDPQSDCTIQINFAPRDPAVVRFSVPEGVSCPDINAYVDDEISLPPPEGEPAVESRSFRFLGWVEAPMDADSLDQPEFLAAGSKVKLTAAEKTYYALYTYFIPADGLEDDQFVRVDEAPHFWSGEYVLTYNGQYALGATTDCMGSTANNRLGVKKAVIDLAAAGLSYEDNILSGVTPEITYVVEPVGDGTFTVKMKSVNHYLAMAAGSESLTTYTSSNSDKTRWTLSWGSNGPVLTNAQYSAYSVQYDAGGKVFKAFSSTQKPLTLFKKAEGENWFTTDPREKGEEEQTIVITLLPGEAGGAAIPGEPMVFSTADADSWADSAKEGKFFEGEGGAWFCFPANPYEAPEGWSFLGWKAEGDEIIYIPASSWVASNTTYTAVWAREYRLTTTPVEDYAQWGPVPATAGEGKTIAIIPRLTEEAWQAGYRLEKLTISDPEGNLIQEFTAALNGVPFTEFEAYPVEGMRTYPITFKMPASDVVLTVSFLEPVPAHECAISQFEDVMEAYPDPESPEHQAIEWAFTHEPQITSGMNDTTFGVGLTLTRAQAATFLYAAAGKPEFDAENAENPFADVKPGKWYTTPVLWAYAQGLVSGMNATTYGVNGNLTRGQIMVILYAWAGKPSVEGMENPYTDVPAGKWFTNAAIWAYHMGIEGGADGKFVQSTPCTRESMVLYLYRYLEGKCLTNE